MGIYDYYPLQWEMLKNSYITSGKDAATAASLATSKIGSTLKYNPLLVSQMMPLSELMEN